MTLEQFNFTPKNTSQIITWQFTCENQFVKNHWVTALLTLKQHYVQQKANILRFFEKTDEKGSNSPKTPWRDSLVKNQESKQDPMREQRESFKLVIQSKQQPKLSSKLELKTSFKPQPIIQPPIKIQPIQSVFFQNISTKNEEVKSQPIISENPFYKQSEEKTIMKKIAVTYSDSQNLHVSQEQSDPSSPLQQQQFFSQEKQSPAKKQRQLQIFQPQSFKTNKQFESPLWQKSSFRSLLQQAFDKQQSFSYRLKAQIQVRNYINDFRWKAQIEFMHYVNTKTFEGRFQSMQIKNSSYIILRNKSIQMRIGKSLSQKKKFDETQIKNIKKEFKAYQYLFHKLIKKMKDNKSQLTVPLSVYLQYRGVCCLVIEAFNQQNIIDYLPDQQLLHDSRHFIWSKEGPYFRIDLKSYFNLQTNKKHHQITFDPPFDRQFVILARKQGASTSESSLELYIKGITYMTNFHGVCPKQQILTALNCCLFCKRLRKIYRSAQGQVDQTTFFNLVFNQNTTLLPLLKQANCQQIPPLNGQLLSFIQEYFGVTFEFKLQTGQIKLSKAQIKPLFREYTLEGTELYETCNRFDSYIEENQLELANAALNLMSQKDDKKKIKEMLLLYASNKYVPCLQKYKQIKSSLSRMSSGLFNVYLFLIRIYSCLQNETQLSLTVKETIQLLAFNYGNKNSSFINFYCLTGFSYFALGIKYQTIAVTFLRQAQQLTLELFGEISNQHFNILLDLSKLHRSTDRSLSLKYFTDARLNYENNVTLQSQQNLVLLLTVEVELCLQFKLVGDGEKSLQKLLAVVAKRKIIKDIKSAFKLSYQFGVESNKNSVISQAVQGMWKIGYQKQALKMIYSVLWSNQNKEQIFNNVTHTPDVFLDEVQERLSFYDNLFDMMVDVKEENNQLFISKVRSLIQS